MRLSDVSLEDRRVWEAAGFDLPGFDRRAVIERTKQRPQWLHFGSGNIFRGFLADIQQRLLNTGAVDRGIITVAGYDLETVERVYRPYDNLGILVILKADGTMEKRVLASVTESLIADPVSAVEDWRRLEQIFAAPSLQMVSFTVTEKGYALDAGSFTGGPGEPQGFIAKITALCYARFRAAASPLALVSMDNCSQNGKRLHDAVAALAQAWEDRGLVSRDFPDWIDNPAALSFPWTMIDKITPRPDPAVQAALETAGLEDRQIIITGKNTWIAPFVNAEETGYLVIEDWFPNGRPPLEQAGVIITDRDTVSRVERMKVCTCLNPLHTALAIYGCLLGYTTIHEEMKDPLLKALVQRLGYTEGLPVVTDPGIIDPRAFLQEVLERRFPNPFVPDTPQRIACDTSQKLPVRFGETLKGILAQPGASVKTLVAIPLVFAGWFRYLMGQDDQGQPFDPSPDPLLDSAREAVASLNLGEVPSPGVVFRALEPLLKNPAIFGVDLTAVGLAEPVAAYFSELIAGPGAVRATLETYIGGK